MVELLTWSQAKPYVQQFLDAVGKTGEEYKFLGIGGVAFLHHADQLGKSDFIKKNRPRTEDIDYAFVSGPGFVIDLADALNTGYQFYGLLFEHNGMNHEVFDPSFVSGNDSKEYREAERKIATGEAKPVMTSKNGKAEYYIDMKAWKVNKETCRREKDIWDLLLLEEIKY